MLNSTLLIGDDHETRTIRSISCSGRRNRGNCLRRRSRAMSATDERVFEKSLAAVAQALVDVLDGRNGTAAAAVLDESSLLHVPGRSGLSGRYQGGAAIVGLLRRMAELTHGSMRFESAQTLAADGRLVVVCGRVVANRQANTLDTTTAHVVMLRGHKVGEMWMVHQDQDQFDAFWN
jgi:hypothetical protein